MTDDELRRIFRSLPDGHGGARRQTFRLGDSVRIKSGPFASFAGRIEGINQVNALLKVSVEVFGRTRPVKLSFFDVEKWPAQ